MHPTREPPAVGAPPIVLTHVLPGFLLWLPRVAVFGGALSKGLDAALEPLAEPDALSAIELALIVAVVSVPLNSLCGLAAAWCIGRFRFRGRSLLITLIGLPFSVSP